jgi:hypothetical protein
MENVKDWHLADEIKLAPYYSVPKKSLTKTKTPVKSRPNNLDELFGMFTDGKLSTQNFIRQKQIEKELER